jgi:20S proteasome subunit beta 3
MMLFKISFVLLLIVASFSCQAQRSDPSQFNGGSILAMAGRNCVAIAIDARFGLGMQTISTGDDHHDNNVGDGVANDDDRIAGEGVGNPRILQLPNSNVLLAWAGLYGDGLGFAEEMNLLLARKVRRAACMGFPGPCGGGGIGATKRKTSPRAITMLMSNLLYRRRNAPYYVEPVIVGLETVRVPISERNGHDGGSEDSDSSSKEPLSLIQGDATMQLAYPRHERRTTAPPTAYKTIQKPYLCGTDMLGAQSTSESFVCSGVASRSLHGTAEALWEPNLEGEELVEICGRAFISALERDILSGYGAVVYLIQGGQDENDVQIVEYVLACRND